MSTSNSERDELTIENLKDALEQACKDLNEAHDEIMKLQDVDRPQNHDWPEWTSQSYTIRWAERLLEKRLAKTPAWSHYPNVNDQYGANDSGKDSALEEAKDLIEHYIDLYEHEENEKEEAARMLIEFAIRNTKPEAI